MIRLFSSKGQVRKGLFGIIKQIRHPCGVANMIVMADNHVGNPTGMSHLYTINIIIIIINIIIIIIIIWNFSIISFSAILQLS